MKYKLILALIILTALLLIAVPVFAQEEGSTGIITGSIVNGSPEGVVPEEMELMLHGWDQNFEQKLMIDGFSEPDGAFEFGDVILDPNLLYAVMLTYNDVTYASAPARMTQGVDELSVEIPIFESTTDTASVRVERKHVLFDADLDGLQVGEIYILSNTGDQTITSSAGDPDAPLASLTFPLPEEATNISFNERESGLRFLLAPGGFVDTAPLKPGSNTGQIVVTYVLPYEDALTYSQTSKWPVEQLSFLVTSNIGLELDGENLALAGTQQMEGGGEIEVFNYGAVDPGEKVSVSLSGALLRPTTVEGESMTAAVEDEAGSSSRRNLAIGGAVFGLALLAVGVWWYRRPDSEDMVEEQDISEDSYNQLVTQIAQLDEAHVRGEITGSEYSGKREQLVQQAAAMMTQSTNPPEQDAVNPSPSY